MKKIILLNYLLCVIVFTSKAQETFPRNDIRDNRENAYALTNGTIFINYKTKLPNSTLLIRKGKVVKVLDSTVAIPKGYTVVDLQKNYVYPSIIDPYTNYGLEGLGKKKSSFSFRTKEQIQSKTKGAFNSNEAIKSEYSAASNFSVNTERAKLLRQQGFGAVVTLRFNGLARGTGALVTLNEARTNTTLLNSRVCANYSFKKGSSKQLYPISTMGYIAVLRQTYLDASWYKKQHPKPFKDLSLEHWNLAQSLPQLIETKGWMEALRADKLGDEFGVQYIIKGGGDEYQRINEIKTTEAQFIIPVNFPSAYKVDDPFDTKEISLEKMKHWELAPKNPAALDQSGIEFAFTASGLSSIKDFLPNIRKAIDNGLSKEVALKAMTYTPAKMMRESQRLGGLENGKIANFIITSNPIFNKEAVILENWVQGTRYKFKPLNTLIEGKYLLTIGSEIDTLEILETPKNLSSKILLNDTTTIKVKIKFDPPFIKLSYSPKDKKGFIRLVGWSNAKGWSGKGQLIDGRWVAWRASRIDKDNKVIQKKEEKKKEPIGAIIYPFIAHGNITPPKEETILIKNATLWTNEAEGIVEQTDILLEKGKIAKIGKNLVAPNSKIIDAEGKHITSGIIDEHSHIAASSINDLATNSSMVRIGDVLDPTDFHIYTSLSGGVTAVQILHGSANPIGGQSALIKLRWGSSPEGMKIKGADNFIKFALGENVKRTYNANSIRFPQTRMGVEQVFIDAFSNALEYKKRWENYNNLPPKLRKPIFSPRKDLIMEAMVEILDKKRFISCHSYVQSEINMLMKVANQFDFKINTFTHILEGYKVADKMKAHGVGASTFSDWWAYKWEVRYAIPYNAAIMHKVGLVVAINSDDAEMGRRLNQEAAKTIKYGGLSQEEAWKTITLNPAKLLHLDKQMGSLKVGKDADVVIWNTNPLSIYAKVETTIIDGAIYFDTKKDVEMNDWIKKERARLIQKMQNTKSAPGRKQNPRSEKPKLFHCDDLTTRTNSIN